MAKVERKHLTAGIDVGSSAVKATVIRSRAGEEVEVLATRVERIRRRNVFEVARETFAVVCAAAGVEPDDFDYVTSTGDSDAVDYHTGSFYSMTTHARGALVLDPEVRAVLDVGALHARAIKIDERGKVLGHRMTSQCASGSGQFLENIARYLGVPIDDVGPLSTRSQSPEKCSGICAVLAETDVINMVSRGIATADILKGIHLSIANRLVRLLRAASKEGGVVMVTGGLAQDVGLLAAMEEILAEEKEKDKAQDKADVELRTHPDSILAGALGAAALGAYRYDQLERLGRLPALAA